MMYSIRGRILEKNPQYAIIEAGSVGYGVFCSAKTLSSLPPVGEEAFLLTHMVLREDALALYGFSTQEEKEIFLKLIAISGIGPKVALSTLSSFDVKNLLQIVDSENVSKMATVPGVGKKSAQRMILELKGSLKDFLPKDESPAAGAHGPSEAVQALLAMGFSFEESQLALKGYEGPADDSSAAVRYALKRVGGGF